MQAEAARYGKEGVVGGWKRGAESRLWPCLCTSKSIEPEHKMKAYEHTRSKAHRKKREWAPVLLPWIEASTAPMKTGRFSQPFACDRGQGGSEHSQ